MITGSYHTFDYTIIVPEQVEYSCLWLHGYQERAHHILSHFPLEKLANQYHTAIVIPDVSDCYYLNQPWKHLYTEDVLLKEFIPYLQSNYQLFTCRSTAFIGGISMGGFGSLLLGSHSDFFSKIVCISAAFILDDITNGNPEVVGSDNVTHFHQLFGDFSTLRESVERNPIQAARSALRSSKLPPLFFACGTDDLLFTRNQKAYDTLLQAGADVTWFEQSGNHNRDFFTPAIEAAFHWLFHSKKA